jgi:hypothetical protein
MVKERCSAEQLARMIVEKINVTGVDIAVRRDHAYGFVPTVVSAPSDQIGFQRRADKSGPSRTGASDDLPAHPRRACSS